MNSPAQANNIGVLFQNSTAVVNLSALAVNGSATEFATVGKDGFLSVWDGSTGQFIVSHETIRAITRLLQGSAYAPHRSTSGEGGMLLLCGRAKADGRV